MRGQGMLTKEFDHEVWRCKCGCIAPPDVCRQLERTHARWWAILQEGRTQLGREDIGVYITNGYRCLARNTKVKGEPNSYHMRGMAADGQPKDWTVLQLYEAAKIVRGGFDGRKPIGGGIGIYRTFIHCDTRPQFSNWDERK